MFFIILDTCFFSLEAWFWVTWLLYIPNFLFLMKKAQISTDPDIREAK